MKILYWILSFAVFCISCATTQKSEPSFESAYRSIDHKVDFNRFDEAIQKFKEQNKLSRYQKDLVLFTGSSSIRFWESLDEDMKPFPCVNRGFGGSTIPDVLYYYDDLIKPFHPSIIVFYCGENDISMGYTPEDVYTSFRYFEEKVAADLPNTKIVYITMKPSPSRWELWSDYIIGNHKIRDYINTKDHLFYADVGKVMMGATPQPDESIFIEDMLHMNAAGYKRWTSVIRPIIEAEYPK